LCRLADKHLCSGHNGYVDDVFYANLRSQYRNSKVRNHIFVHVEFFVVDKQWPYLSHFVCCFKNTVDLGADTRFAAIGRRRWCLLHLSHLSSGSLLRRNQNPSFPLRRCDACGHGKNFNQKMESGYIPQILVI
jgi:hypothetical protein